jgi:hypothetical protein
MANRTKKNYFCAVVSEEVEIALLKDKLSFSGESGSQPFVQCNQLECQYVNLNQPPCPLNLDLFVEEIVRIEKRKRKIAF